MRPARADRFRPCRRSGQSGGPDRPGIQGQRLRFRPSAPLDDRRLTDLPEVTGVVHQGRHVVVTGAGNLLHAVTAHLARNQIVAHDLRVEQASLDDAFVTLTGRRLGR